MPSTIRRPRIRRVTTLAAVALLVLASLGVAFGRPWLETRLRARIDREARAHAVVVSIGSIRAGIWPPLALRGVRLAKPGVFCLAIDELGVSWSPSAASLAGVRLSVSRAVASAPAGLVLAVEPTVWELRRASPAGWRAALRAPASGLWATWLPARDADRFEWTAVELAADRFLKLRRNDASLAEVPSVDGHGFFLRTAHGVGFAARVVGRAVRLPALGAEDGADVLGPPKTLTLAFEGSWRNDLGALEVPRFSLALDGASPHGMLSLTELHDDPRVRLSLDVPRVELARLLHGSGVAVPLAAGPGQGAADLGSASLELRADGRLGDPHSFRVNQQLAFAPPRVLPAELLRLRGGFVHTVALRSGDQLEILVSPDSPDFIGLHDVPPLFVRTLLVAEDAGFYGHHGIDFAELPPALLDNWNRGGALRGASTVTQQLAKNLFLSRDKRISRKLQELSLALLLEAALDKRRILEIYLNVIEWGPDLYGLRPAARRYFNAEPSALTPAQAAFLVSLIPGPIKYQQALGAGTPAPWFRTLVDDLLLKLRSLDLISEGQYQEALEDPLRLGPANGQQVRDGT